MSHLILLRHGETEDNVMNAGPEGQVFITGQFETALTARGREQAVAAGKELASIPNMHIQRVLCSNIGRAVETGKLILQQLPEPLTLEITPFLRERSCGVFEGRFVKDVKVEYPEYFSDPRFMRWRTDFVQKAPGGENFTDVVSRIAPYLQPILAENQGDILCVCHIRVICCVLYWLLGLSEEETVGLRIPNAHPIIVKLGTPHTLVGEWTLEKLLPLS